MYMLMAVCVVLAGLLWRSGLIPIPSIPAKYGGDLLWAVVVFLGGGVLFTCSSTVRVAAGAVAFAWTVEFLQLYHAPWIDALRSTTPGRLILGSSFNPPDLLAYLCGILVAAYAEFLHHHRKRGRDETDQPCT